MDKERGLPITAYLGALMALALALAFIAVLAVVIWLPPRPPDVMREDDVAQHFLDGYDFALVEGRPMSGDGMSWSLRDAPPEVEGRGVELDHTRFRLAQRLSLDPEQVAVAAANVARDEVYVFRVRQLEDARAAGEAARQVIIESRETERDIRREAERTADAEARRAQLEAAREARQDALEALRQAREAGARVIVEGDKITIDVPSEAEIEAQVEAHLEAAGVGQVRSFEFRMPPQAPAPPAPPSGGGPTPAPAPALIAPPLPPPVGPIFAPAPEGVALISNFQIAAELPNGRWLVMEQGRNWAELGWIGRAALIIGATLATLMLLAALFARRLTRPIRNFASAVQAVGVDPQSEPVREEGPRELRGAARAVNAMQARLRLLIADRTKTLAAVAHDMRTPLMRLRLAAENAPSEQRERMAKEIAEVEALVASFIAFARDDPAEEARVRLDLSALLQSIADDHAAGGRAVSFEGEERCIITGQSLGLKRLFANLIENALKYGGVARIKLRRGGAQIVVDVEDDGPGVPAAQRESVFEPFVRLGHSENAAPGAGLGLPAARSIARAHGGDVVIEDGAAGACVRVTLPA